MYGSTSSPCTVRQAHHVRFDKLTMYGSTSSPCTVRQAHHVQFGSSPCMVPQAHHDHPEPVEGYIPSLSRDDLRARGIPHTQRPCHSERASTNEAMQRISRARGICASHFVQTYQPPRFLLADARRNDNFSRRGTRNPISARDRVSACPRRTTHTTPLSFRAPTNEICLGYIRARGICASHFVQAYQPPRFLLAGTRRNDNFSKTGTRNPISARDRVSYSNGSVILILSKGASQARRRTTGSAHEGSQRRTSGK